MSSKKTAPIWIVVAVCALGVSAVAAYVRTTPHIAKKDLQPPVTQAPAVERSQEPSEAPKPVEVAVYKPFMGPDGIAFEKTTVSVPTGEDERLFAVNAFLKIGHIVPAGSKALGVEVIDGVAHVTFNRAFEQTYGSFDEKSLLDGFGATFGQFDEVKGVQLEIEGQPIKTLGNVDLTEPIPVIRPTAVPLKGQTAQPAESSSDSDAKPPQP